MNPDEAPERGLCNAYYGDITPITHRPRGAICVRREGHPPISDDSIGHSDDPKMAGK